MTADRLRTLVARFAAARMVASGHLTSGEDCNLMSHRQTDADVACMVAAMALAEAVSASPDLIELLARSELSGLPAVH